MDEGYVDEDADVMKKIGNFFRGNKDKKDDKAASKEDTA